MINGAPYALIGGVRVFGRDAVPEFTAKLSISDACPCSDEVRADINSWLLSMFGSERTFVGMGGVVVTHPNTLKIIAGDSIFY